MEQFPRGKFLKPSCQSSVPSPVTVISPVTLLASSVDEWTSSESLISTKSYEINMWSKRKAKLKIRREVGSENGSNNIIKM